MLEATREYFDLIGMRSRFVDTIEKQFSQFGELTGDESFKTITDEVLRLLDYEGMISEIGEVFETMLSQEEILEVSRLYKENPVLRKITGESDKFMEAAGKIGEKYMEKAVHSIGAFVEGDAQA